jgi:manganese-dependent inorganic pyrophosphatase
MAHPVIIVGHKNPDNDSIASAVSLAYLNNQLAAREKAADPEADVREYAAVRLGPLPPESQWVLESVDLPLPDLIDNVYPCAADIMAIDMPVLFDDATLTDAMKTMQAHGCGALGITDAAGKFEGLVTMRMIGKRCVAAAIGDGEELNGSFTSALYQNVGFAKDADAPVFAPDTQLVDIEADFAAASSCWGAVVDADGKLAGIVNRSDTQDAPKRDVILVDHNELCQAADGMPSANVVQIIDHHRIGDVTTANPIPFTALPWGSTATIITTRFREYGIEIPISIAKVLLSAILTDTVILKSPTTTEVDEEQAAYLSGLVGVDAREFGLQVFRCRGGEADMEIEEFVCADSKEFKVGETTVLIAQHETVDLQGAMEREGEAREYMRQLVEQHAYDFALLLVTDILEEGSNFIVEGNHRLVDRVFGIDSSGVVWMPGVLSRKKQVAAPILSA